MTFVIQKVKGRRARRWIIGVDCAYPVSIVTPYGWQCNVQIAEQKASIFHHIMHRALIGRRFPRYILARRCKMDRRRRAHTINARLSQFSRRFWAARTQCRCPGHGGDTPGDFSADHGCDVVWGTACAQLHWRCSRLLYLILQRYYTMESVCLSACKLGNTIRKTFHETFGVCGQWDS